MVKKQLVVRWNLVLLLVHNSFRMTSALVGLLIKTPAHSAEETACVCLHTVPKQFGYGLDDPRNKTPYWLRSEGGSLSVFSQAQLNRAGVTASRCTHRSFFFFFSFLLALLPLHHAGEELWSS